MLRSGFLSVLLGCLIVAACGGAQGEPVPAQRGLAAAPSCAPAIAPSVASPEFPGELSANQGYWLGSPRRMKPTEDGRHVLYLRAPVGDPGARASLWETEVATGKSRELVTPDAALRGGAETVSAEERARRERQRIRGGGFTGFEASADGAVVILQLSGRLHAFSRADGKLRELPTGEGAFDPQLSPDAKRVAYVRDNDVYVLALDGGREVAVTRGGTELRPNGVAEFMAQEEFYRRTGFWWSPDGNHILYQQSDLVEGAGVDVRRSGAPRSSAAHGPLSAGGRAACRGPAGHRVAAPAGARAPPRHLGRRALPVPHLGRVAEERAADHRGARPGLQARRGARRRSGHRRHAGARR